MMWLISDKQLGLDELTLLPCWSSGHIPKCCSGVLFPSVIKGAIIIYDGGGGGGKQHFTRKFLRPTRQAD